MRAGRPNGREDRTGSGLTRRRAASVLLLGFEPFGGDVLNPAQEVCRRLDGKRVAGHRIRSALLPVSFAAALTDLAHELERDPPRLVLAIGLAGGRARLSLERVALNLIDARIADNHGAQPIDVPVIAGAPAAYFANLPLKAMVRAMQSRGIPAELSLTAGTYVCNAVFFALRHLAATRWPTLRAGFMHLPWLPEQAAHLPGVASMSLEMMCEGTLAALEAALTQEADLAESGGTLS